MILLHSVVMFKQFYAVFANYSPSVPSNFIQDVTKIFILYIFILTEDRRGNGGMEEIA